MEWVQRPPIRPFKESDSIKDKLAKIRGLKPNQVNDYLKPTSKYLHDTSTMKNIDLASKRIARAIIDRENIVISGDNDADGVTSTTIMYKAIDELWGGEDSLLFGELDYIYAQRKWGHGIKNQTDIKRKHINMEPEKLEDIDKRNENAEKNKQMIQEADLLIIVDSSSNDVETLIDIQENGTDVVVLDHHGVDHDTNLLDYGVILVNPNQKGCEYPNKHLSGAGVVYKVVRHMVDNVQEIHDSESDLYFLEPDQFLDLVAVGLNADLMDMSEMENRYLVSVGLQNINNVGIERILKSGKQDLYRLDGDSIGFTIAPMINGTARLEVIEDAFELLLCKDDEEAKPIRRRMNTANEKRKKMQKEFSEELMKDIDNSKKFIFIMTEESLGSFNGLIAQEIATKLDKPVFVGKKTGEKVSGSARSVNGFDMQSFMQKSNLVSYASGHPQAFGMAFNHSDLESIYDYIDRNAEELSIEEPVLQYDLALNPEEAIENLDLIEEFNKFSGINARKITIKVDDLTVLDRSVIGKSNNTVKFLTEDEFNLIKFRVDEEYAKEINAGDVISVVGNIKMNVFTKFYPKPSKVIKTPQIMIEDYKEKGDFLSGIDTEES